MKKPNLSSIETLLSTGKKFALTETQYSEETNASMPKNIYYLENNSAIAKLAKRYGFKIVLQEKTIMFEKDD